MRDRATPLAQMAPRAGRSLGLCAMIAAAAALIQPWEGLRRAPYRDMVGVATVCFGETRVPMRRYSTVECEALLRQALSDDFAPPVLRAVPELIHHPGPFIASISLAYNIGPSAFARSTVARRFNAGDWRGGCEAFGMWRMAGGKIVQGLVNRRAAERQVCLGHAP